jgi:hypothetical protein
MRDDQLKVLEARGIVVPPYAEYIRPEWRSNTALALDAQPSMITASNIGIPAYIANLLDPKTIRVLTVPMKAAEICGEQKKGDWTTVTTQFPVVESLGTVASYGDFSNDGSVGSNYNWVPRQSYHWQTVTVYGDRETEMFGLAQINYVSDLNFSSALLMSKFLNQTYLYGVQGVNVGILSDPALLTPVTPVTKEGGGYTWGAASAVEIFNDVMLLYTTAQTNLAGMIDRDTKMTLVMSPIIEPYLSKVTKYTLASVREAIMKNWPNLKIVTVPEYNTVAGELIQLWVDELEGDKTGFCAFTEKLRAGRVIPELSSFKQKKVAGSWGAVIKRPVAIAQGIGY